MIRHCRTAARVTLAGTDLRKPVELVGVVWEASTARAALASMGRHYRPTVRRGKKGTQ